MTEHVSDDPIPRDTSPEAIARLIAARRKYETARRVLVVLFLIGTLAVVGVGLAILVKVKDTSDQIADCLSPAGACYQRSLYGEQVRQTNAVNLARLCAQLKVTCEPIPQPPTARKEIDIP